MGSLDWHMKISNIHLRLQWLYHPAHARLKENT